jgi:5-methylcytosine-specific restriction endonuclease McrA
MTTPSDIDIAFDRVAAMLRTAGTQTGADERDAKERARLAVAEFKVSNGLRRNAARKVAQFEFLRPVPLLGSAVLSPLEFDLAEADRRARAARTRAERLLKRVEEAALQRRDLGRLLARSNHAHAACAHLGSPPLFVRQAFEALGSTIASLVRRSETRRIEDVRKAAVGLIEFVEGWAAAAARIQREAVRPPPSDVPAVLRTVSTERIWLPISWNRRREAIALGAKVDMSAGKGSDLFVTGSQDLRPFQRMLPLIHRSRRPEPFAFPPIAAKAAGQNLWTLFDKATWDHVRTTNYARSGFRCVLCGEQNARAADGGSGRGPVDAHEVWSWSMPDDDPSAGIGIQRLERIMTLCPACHACFHASNATTRARRDARFEEAAAFIRQRQMDINGMSAEELDGHLARSAEDWDRTRGVDRWILDLSHLAAQDYMADADPVFLAGNPAGFAPEDVAGLAFTADDGRRFPARDAQTLQQSLLEDAPRLRLAWSRP